MSTEVVELWWNGTWGRLARRDVALRTNGEQWEVWVRTGGVESDDHVRTVYDSESRARAELARYLGDGRQWVRKEPKRR